MALFKQHRKMDEQIEIELAYMRITHDRNSINAQFGGIIQARAGGDCRTGDSMMSDDCIAPIAITHRVYAPFAKRG